MAGVLQFHVIPARGKMKGERIWSRWERKGGRGWGWGRETDSQSRTCLALSVFLLCRSQHFGFDLLLSLMVTRWLALARWLSW